MLLLPLPPCSYVNVVSVSFAQPDCSYVKGSLSLQGTGLSFSSDGPTVKAAIAALKAAQPNTRVMLAVGGATYTNFAALNTACIKNVVDDFGFDGECAWGLRLQGVGEIKQQQLGCRDLALTWQRHQPTPAATC